LSFEDNADGGIMQRKHACSLTARSHSQFLSRRLGVGLYSSLGDMENPGNLFRLHVFGNKPKDLLLLFGQRLDTRFFSPQGNVSCGADCA
jgi:hypothetical protein